MESLHPKAALVFFLKKWLPVSFGLAWSLSMSVLTLTLKRGQEIVVLDFFMSWSVFFISAALLAFALSVLEAQSYKYEVRNDVFRKEFGVFTKRYTSIPYDRIQNVDLYRGIADRMFDLAQLQIQTAGSSVQGAVEGLLPGLAWDDAERLRDKILELAKGSKQKSV